jgi:hypothetical protein
MYEVFHKAFVKSNIKRIKINGHFLIILVTLQMFFHRSDGRKRTWLNESTFISYIFRYLIKYIQLFTIITSLLQILIATLVKVSFKKSHLASVSLLESKIHQSFSPSKFFSQISFNVSTVIPGIIMGFKADPYK